MFEEKNTKQQHAGAGRDLRRGRGRLQVPVHRQRRRLGQQVVSVPGDAVDPHARPHAGVSQGEGAHPRHRGVPALSSGDRHRRHVGRAHHEDGEARLDALLRRAADQGLGGRPRLPRSRDGAGSAEDDAGDRRRRAVRRQIFLPRRARDPAAAARRVAADRAWRVVLGRPPGSGQDHQGRRVPRAARASSGAVSAGVRPEEARRRGRQDRPQQADAGNPGDAVASIRSRRGCQAQRPDDRRARPGARQAARAAGARRGPARLFQEPSGLLRRPGQDAGRVTPRAPSGRPRRGAWIPMSTSSRRPAAR